MSDRDDGRTARMISRGQTKKAGDRSSTLARQLMKLAAPALRKLEIDDPLRDAITGARAVTSLIARRRAERTLAGALRRYDLVALAADVARVVRGDEDVQQFHLAEHWRARLLAEGAAGVAAFAVDFPAATDDSWPRLVDAAQRERDTGRPPGAGRALFREVIEAIKIAQAPAESDADADADADPEADADADAESDADSDE